MRLCVEHVLPEYFFTLIGKYIQTYAYIEQSIWLTICDTQPNRPVTSNEMANFLQIRTNTEKLKEEAEKCCARLPVELSHDFSDCLQKFNVCTFYRNIIVHGAWSFDSDDQNFCADYSFNNGTKKNPDMYLLNRSDFDLETIVREGDNLDRLLRRFIEIRQDILEFTTTPPDTPAAPQAPAGHKPPAP